MQKASVLEALDTTVTHAGMQAKHLFICKEDKKGCTTGWEQLYKVLPTLVNIFKLTGGRMLKHKKFDNQLK